MVAAMQVLNLPFSEYGGKFSHMLVAVEQKSSLRSYFSKNQMVATPIFGSVISLDIYETCMSMDTSEVPPKDLIYPIVRHADSKFQTLDFPQQDILNDESLTFWKAAYSSNHTRH